MKFDHFKPPEESEEYTGPTKEELLTQIESDYYNAKVAGNDDHLPVLDERHAAVKAATSDTEAKRIYDEMCATLPEVDETDEGTAVEDDEQ